MLTRPAALAAALLALTAAPAAAQKNIPETIETDRPDITEASSVVGKGVFQTESGFYQEYFNRRRIDERNLFRPTLLRWGFDPRWEARLETDAFSRSRLSTPRGVRRTTGYSPIELGFKHALQSSREGSLRPELAVLAHVGLPIGSSDFSQDHVTGTVKALMGWDLGERWSLGSNAGLFLEEDDSGSTFVSTLLTGSLGYSITDRLSTFVELAHQLHERAGGGDLLILDGGFTYLLSDDTQLDLAVGTGLSGRTAADFFWTVGFSRRW
ncbi:MAG: transporter [Armatimonadota bacterium]